METNGTLNVTLQQLVKVRGLVLDSISAENNLNSLTASALRIILILGVVQFMFMAVGHAMP